MCTVNLGFLGPLPVPRFRNYCLGTVREFGSHVGDWEHMSLNFEVCLYEIIRIKENTKIKTHLCTVINMLNQYKKMHELLGLQKYC